MVIAEAAIQAFNRILVSRNVIPEEFHSAPEKLTTFALGKSADTI
jgi:hypothetical protein